MVGGAIARLVALHPIKKQAQASSAFVQAICYQDGTTPCSHAHDLWSQGNTKIMWLWWYLTKPPSPGRCSKKQKPTWLKEQRQSQSWWGGRQHEWDLEMEPRHQDNSHSLACFINMKRHWYTSFREHRVCHSEGTSLTHWLSSQGVRITREWGEQSVKQEDIRQYSNRRKNTWGKGAYFEWIFLHTGEENQSFAMGTNG